MSDKPIIEVKDLWKGYGLPPLLPWKKRADSDREWALRDINFSVPRGGSLGILGRNGAGKSTLLKLLAGVTPPDKGHIAVRGSIFPMIELAAGMSMELSGRENVRVLGTIMGLSSAEITQIIPKVEEFSELEHWFTRPVWKYSSGMVGRLAFGIAVNMQADILLVDEVLATGDILFQKKCQLKVQELLSGGTTLLFVTHSPYQMEKLCEDGMLLEKGACVMQSDSSATMQEYLRRTVGAASAASQRARLEGNIDLRPGTGDVRILRTELLNEDGESVISVDTGSPVTIKMAYRAREDVSPVNISISVYNASNVPITVFAPPRESGDWLDIKEGEGTIECRIPSLNIMGQGLFLNIKVSSTYVLDSVEQALIFDAVPQAEHAQRTGTRGVMFCENHWHFS